MPLSPPTDPKVSQFEGLPDLLLNNVPIDDLKRLFRELLMTDINAESKFEQLARSYVESLPSMSEVGPLFTGSRVNEAAHAAIRRTRALSGCGLYFETLPLLQAMVEQVTSLKAADLTPEVDDYLAELAGDIIEVMCGIQRIQQVENGIRELKDEEKPFLESLQATLVACGEAWKGRGQTFSLVRALVTVQKTIDPHCPVDLLDSTKPGSMDLQLRTDIETFKLGDKVVPRIFSGLWQLATAEYGTASVSKITAQFLEHARAGFTAFDMGDHYGDAEILFGHFRRTLKDPDLICGSTKYCVFNRLNVTREAVRENISQRCSRMQMDKLDVLQVHWQWWDHPHYINLLRYCQEDERVRLVSLCNFDTEHMHEAFNAGIKFQTNQVQFSLIDSRPTVKMGKFCTEHGIKLMAFGCLCGGFISKKWLGKPEPEVYSKMLNPSNRMYFASINDWGGWDLFQELLQALDSIANKHKVLIANVATRWVLDHQYVGAVLLGARMGVSHHLEDNLRTYHLTLDDEDRDAIEAVLKRSSRQQMFEQMGDCGWEYRT